MKTLRYFATYYSLLLATQSMQAQVEALFADPVTIKPGEVAEIVVRIDYDINQGYSYQDINSYSFHLTMPEGIVPNTKSGKWTRACVTLSEETHPYLYDDETEEYTQSPKSGLSMNTTEGGDVLFIWMTVDDAPRQSLLSTHGELMRISVKAEQDFVSGTGRIYDIMLAKDSYAFDLYNIADVPVYFNEDITPVKSVVNDGAAGAHLYTLQGIRTNGSKKGLYISNKKKKICQ